MDNIKIFCWSCNNSTNHTIQAEFKQKFYDDCTWYYAHWTWQIAQCDWCENVCFQEIWADLEDIDYDTNQPSISTKVYPKSSKDILQVKNYYNVDKKVRKIYRETIDAFNNWLYILCAWGLRSVIDWICNTESIVDWVIEIDWKFVRRTNLQWKISWLSEKWLLTKKHADILHEHRFLWNEALHDLDEPSKEELRLAIEIIEHTLDNLYELSIKLEDLKEKRLKRRR